MIQRRVLALVVAPLAFLLPSLCAAGDNPPQTTSTSKVTQEKLTSQGRIAIIRGLGAELAYARRPFPLGKTGVTIKNGVVADEQKVSMAVAAYGVAIKPGDQARITQIVFKPKSIIFELNGGPERKQKWYEHIEIDGMGGAYSPAQNIPPEQLNIHGSYVMLAFDKQVPNVSPEEVKKTLGTVLNFNARSASEAYLDTVPPKVKKAITTHQVLVGMDQDMVLMALGRPFQKIREKDPITGNQYEEWIYGQPPQEVKFVRFIGDEVVRLEIMQVNGQKLVKTEKEVDLKKPTVDVAQQTNQPQVVPVNRPSLRRPGEDGPDENTGSGGAVSTQPYPQQVPTNMPGGPTGPDPNAPQGGGPTPPVAQPPPMPVPTRTQTSTPDDNGPPMPGGPGPN
ncbi:MAG TPA: hypothetical protein VKW78_19115 [Terriglobales bacterium]|nr:hypothetical protein [Terriglobales bacterium]